MREQDEMGRIVRTLLQYIVLEGDSEVLMGARVERKENYLKGRIHKTRS